MDQAHRACGTGVRHLGLRGAPERDRARHQPAVALDHHPADGHDDGRDLLPQGPGGRLRRGRRLRISFRCTRAAHHRRRGLTHEPIGDQVITGAQCLAEMLGGYGVTHVFMLPAVLRRTFADMERRPSIARVHLQFRGNEGELDQEEADIAPLVEPQFARVPPYRPLPDPHQLKKLLEELQHAERPVIVAGGGARWSGAGPELVQLAEALAIPVATSLNGKELIPGAHRLAVGVVGSYSRESANRVVAAADLVCFVGSSAGGMTTHAWAVPKIGTPALQIDIEPETIGRNYPLKASVLADAKVALAQMLAQCDRSTAGKRKPWIDRVHGLCSEWRDKYGPVLSSDAQPIRPERICAELTRHVPDDAIVLADTGHAGMWMGGMYDLRTERQSFMRSAGHLGWAFPAGLGAKCAAPQRPVVTFTGDA